MTEYLDELYEIILEFLPIAMLAIFALLVIVSVIVPLLIRFAKRISLSVKNKEWMPKWLYKEQEALLSLTPIVELFAPHQQHIQDIEPEQKRPWKPARFTPWERAVKTAYRTHRQPRCGFFDAPAQVATAARAFQFRLLTEHEIKVIPDYVERNHYIISFNFSGLAAEDIEKLYSKIKSQLKLVALTELDRTASVIILRGDKVAVDDVLVQFKHGMEWFKEHPAKSWKSIPIAVDENNNVVKLETHHSLCLAQTGGGKSWYRGLVVQLLPLMQQEKCLIYGIDPKNDDGYKLSSLLTEYTDDTDEAASIISKVYQQMNKHKKTQAASGKKFNPSKETSLTILIIDEFLSLLAEPEFKRTGKPYKQLMFILAQGRAYGTFVYAFTQSASQETLGSNLRNNFANTIILRQSSDYFNELFIFPKAKENGFDSTAIGLSTAANNYRYSGIGFLKDDGAPKRVKFSYVSDDDLKQLTEPYRKKQPAALEQLLDDDSDLFTLI